jgi:ribonuclease HII
MILGIDEVGRGPWAGPLVVGAVVLGETQIDGLTDSKKLSPKKRVALDSLIRETAAGWGLGWVHADELDTLGLSESLRVATIRAVEAIKAPYNEIIIDGTINFLKETTKGKYVTTLAKADLLVPSVSAASIIAKVARDTFMTEQALTYPEYGFEKHVGYGTALHSKALGEYGITPLHRKSFAPIAKIINSSSSFAPAITSNSDITTKKLGDRGEDIACSFLEKQEHVIIERNWKTKWCEIDCVSALSDTLYFTEVKYRHNHLGGNGYEAVTTTKLKQMRFAADFYLSTHKARYEHFKLTVISITGEHTEYLEVE